MKNGIEFFLLTTRFLVEYNKRHFLERNIIFFNFSYTVLSVYYVKFMIGVDPERIYMKEGGIWVVKTLIKS